MPVVRPVALYCVALLAALVLAALRLRDLALTQAPLALWLPFLQPLLSAAFEASLLLAVPVAWLTAWVSIPAAKTRTLVVLGLGLGACSVAGAALTDVGSDAPGRLAQELIETGRQSCESAPSRRVDVPLVAVAWSCPSGAPARIHGTSPNLGASFEAKTLQVSADLRKLELADATLTVPAAKGRIGARLQVARARIQGLPPWGRPRHVSLPLRLLASSFVALAVGAACVAGARWLRHRALTVFAGGAVGVATFVAQQLLDRMGVGPSGYFALAPAAAAACLFLAALRPAGERLIARFRGGPGS